MRFAVISDSHGHTDNVGRLAARLSRTGIRQAVHLGDEYEDAAPLLAVGLEVLRVPGVFAAQYQDPEIPNRIVTDLGGIKVMLTHADAPDKHDRPDDHPPAEMAAAERPDLVLFGHSHLPAIEVRDGILWVNPGHLKPEDKKGAPPSYAVVDTDARPFKVRILAFEDERVLLER
ncbi:MAG: YfcE family phosphodiesterase [Thermodesulfobacteriota bacterium]